MQFGFFGFVLLVAPAVVVVGESFVACPSSVARVSFAFDCLRPRIARRKAMSVVCATLVGLSSRGFRFPVAQRRFDEVPPELGMLFGIQGVRVA